MVRRRGRAAVLALAAVAAAYVATCLLLSAADPEVAFGPADLAARPRLPAGFLWGTATSAHQVEGGNAANDWARFEAEPGRIRNGDRSGAAVDHWNRVGDDVALMKAVGANAYRFSVEWSRVEPAEGSWDEAAWAHYADEVHQLRDAGIEPMVTLLHFTLPAWLAERGGATAADFPARFGRFAAEAGRRLGRDVDLWCTLNEPNVQMYLGYVEGTWPPAVKDHARAVQAFAGLVRAHAAAASALRETDPSGLRGVAMNLIQFDPAARWSLPDWIAAREAAAGFDWAFYDSIRDGRIRFRLSGFPTIDEPLPGLAGSAEYVGVNYYTRDLVRFSLAAPGMVAVGPGSGPRSDSGEEICPEGLLRVLREVSRRYHLPIYVTENGVADADGSRRTTFLRAHTLALARALGEGIPVKGYFHWSLVDNFEWAEGFSRRFGLYRVDYATLQRQPTAAAVEFRRLAPAPQ